MKQDRPTEYKDVSRYSQAESRLINIQKDRMAELEKKLGIKQHQKKLRQAAEIVNNGEPISEDQVQKQKQAIEKMLNVKKLDFILETNNQKVIESYYNLKK